MARLARKEMIDPSEIQICHTTSELTGRPPISVPLGSHRIGRSGPAAGSSRLRERSESERDLQRKIR